MAIKRIRWNEEGRRIGETHPRAVVSDEIVERLRGMHEQGFGIRKLARHFGLRRSTVQKILSFEIRAQVAAREKRVEVADGCEVVLP